MRDMQTKIIAAIRRQIETDTDLETTVQGAWANTGTIYAGRDLSHVAFCVGYSFQATYCVLILKGEIVESAIGEGTVKDDPPKWRVTSNEVAFHHLEYAAGQRLEEMLNLVRYFAGGARSGDVDEHRVPWHRVLARASALLRPLRSRDASDA